MPTSQPLPPKEKTLFNRILKCYEQKQYKNGLKFAKQILSNPKYSEHGETLAMKGLTLNCVGKKEEAYELVKRGLKNDLKSHVCWHVYGLLQRSEKKYDEAIKCYRNALRWDKDNLHILRDLSMLQVHMRDLEGYRDTRYALLQLKPAQRASWIGYAISNHLLKDYMVAFRVLEEFNKTQNQSNDAVFEQSELLLYQVEILCEASLHQNALDHLEKNKEKIVDKLTWQESKGNLLLQLGRTNEAEEIFTDLIYRNPENHKYYEKLEVVTKVSNQEEKLQIYQAVSKLFPKADSPKLIPLKFTQGELFCTLVDQVMRAQLKRAVPTLFTSLKFLYKDPEKVKIIYEIMQGYLQSIEKFSKLAETDNETEPPTAILWVRYFLAQHYDTLGEYDNALQILNEALEHTPTLVDLYILKAKVLKHMGDIAGAVESMDEAQSLDTADRFVNCKCACYMIRNDMITEASDIAAKFTRENVSVDEYLREMQCMWYEVECAATHAGQHRYGEALKKCHEIDRHFSEIIEDQFDFHQYCMRKMTLRSYIKMLKLEDSLRSHKFYFQAARIAIKVYLQLHDDPHKKGDREAEEREAGMTGAELKKLRNKQRRLERKKAAQDEKKKQELDKAGKKRQNKNNKADDEVDSKKVVEFQPEKLIAVEDPLKEAMRFLLPLELHCSKSLETHLFAFQIAERKGKLLLMLRSLLRGMKLESEGDQAEFHLCKVHFLKKVEDSTDLPQPVNEVIAKQINQISNGLTALEFNENFLKENSKSLPHLYAGCKAMYYLNNACQSEALKQLYNFSKDFSKVHLKVCESIFLALNSKSKLDFGVVSDETVEEFRAKFADLFPRAAVFSTQTEKKIQNEKLSEEPKAKLVNGDSNHVNEISQSDRQDKANNKQISKKIEDKNDKIEQLSALVEDHCPHGV